MSSSVKLSGKETLGDRGRERRGENPEWERTGEGWERFMIHPLGGRMVEFFIFVNVQRTPEHAE